MNPLGARSFRGVVMSFLRSDVAGGAVLVLAGGIAFVLANSPWQAGYTGFWGHATHVGTRAFAGFATVQDWVNGGLMAVFFLVVGLEIAREHREGPLGDRRTAVVPVAGAVGGMVGAALVYAAVDHTGAGARGWGVPMATDIAFAMGALALLGRRVPRGLRLLLLALAVADDIGSVVVLAVFYSARTDLPALAAAVAVTAGMVAFRRWGPPLAWPYLVAGAALWVALAAGGVEPALAGVVVGVLVPGSADGRPGPARPLEARLAPVSSLVVLPLFALANAGVTVDAAIFHQPGTAAVFGGVVAARVVGKLAGITLACLVVVRAGVGRLPDGVHWGHVAGAGAVAGIGFTVPVLIAQRAFVGHHQLVVASTLGLMVGSGVAFALGAAVLVLAWRRRDRGPVPVPSGGPVC